MGPQKLTFKLELHFCDAFARHVENVGSELHDTLEHVLLLTAEHVQGLK
jgi:hypothetical protein